ncbi:pilus assembly protein [Ferrimonas sediminicola]|nr:PilC/PilY family type IV pilus protein [Ferrimonas sediminicola]
MRALILAMMIFAVGVGWADDTELYVYGGTLTADSRPQVLIIFDNSGSMKTEEEEAPPPFDPSHDYSGGHDRGRFYYVRGQVNDNLPDPRNGLEYRYFDRELNGCMAAIAPRDPDDPASRGVIDHTGFFTDAMLNFRRGGRRDPEWRWRRFPSSLKQAHEAGIVGSYGFDCLQDIHDHTLSNAAAHSATGLRMNGFPRDMDQAQPYDGSHGGQSVAELDAAAETALSQTSFASAESVTLYTENYLYYLHTSGATRRSRLAIAKEVVSSMVESTPGVDFGLAVFNLNSGDDRDGSGSHGGRLLSGIQQMSAVNKEHLISTVEGLTATTWTPLCETLFEAYRYFSGGALMFGSDTAVYGAPFAAGGRYLSPFIHCQPLAYVVLITDGSPTKDEALNSQVRGELNLTASQAYPVYDPYRSLGSDDWADSYLPALAEHLHTQDINPWINGRQSVVTYTIGFSQDGIDSAGALLAETAKRGGGQYFPAASAQALQNALQRVFSEILAVDASFTSPSIAANSFDRTQTLDSVYYSMFLPSDRPRWSGNLKKLKILASGRVVDARGGPGIDQAGNIAETACTFWTLPTTCTLAASGGDGHSVGEGGAAESLVVQAQRRVLVEPASGSGPLVPLSQAALEARAGGSAELLVELGIVSQELAGFLAWMAGQDVDDEDQDGDLTETRHDLMGDPLHSKPLAIHYGEGKGVRILVGTNAGVLHMFQDGGDRLSESWSFRPHRFLGEQLTLRTNPRIGGHSVYGVDGSPVAYIEDGNEDGEIDASAGDRAWLFFGLRRGGRAYFALDLTDPDAPSLMWIRSAVSDGLSMLGQSWSEPVVTRIPDYPKANLAATAARPVLIIGGGYDPHKDLESVGSPDTLGRAVFILDAQTGELVHRFSPDGGDSEHTRVAFEDSIPGRVAALDSDGDGLTDRLYAADTGGNVWRLDLPGVRSVQPWTGFRFADLGGSTLASDRRFHHEVAVAQTKVQRKESVTETVNGESVTRVVATELPYDAVVIGSGNRAHPNAIGTQDRLFVLRDLNLYPRSFDGDDAPGHAQVPEPITLDQLFDVTADPLGQSADAETRLAQELLAGSKLGWSLGLAEGEKALAAATVLGGNAYFTTFVPGNQNLANACLSAGQGRLYVLNLHLGINLYRHRYLDLGARLPDTPQVVVPPPSDPDDPSWNPRVFLVGVGQGFTLEEGGLELSNSGSGDTAKVLVPRYLYYYQGGE